MPIATALRSVELNGCGDPTASPSRILVVEDEPAISDVVSTAAPPSRPCDHHGRRRPPWLRSRPFRRLRPDRPRRHAPASTATRSAASSVRRARSPQSSSSPHVDAPDDRIEGFVNGGDDYLTKPFSVDELVLRVATILRRTGREAPSDRLLVADLVLDPSVHEVRRDRRLIGLSPTEFRLLHYLMVNTGTVLSKAQILVNVWDHDDDVADDVVELYIGYLRRKVDDDHRPLIHTPSRRRLFCTPVSE